MAAESLEPLPPEEAVAFFRSKGYTIGFDWRDVWQEEHARAFTVAKAMRYDVLKAIRQEVDRALADGLTFQQFREALEPRLVKLGWWGRQDMIDPRTGVERLVQLGSPRRLRTIYDTNLRMANAAGRWERIQRTAGRRPWLRYVAVLDSRTRPLHRAWHGTVLDAADRWWRTHYPPNGWHCRCVVQQLSDRDLERFGHKPSPTAPKIESGRWKNRRTGQVQRIPKGIDPGFAYNVGLRHMDGLTPPPMSGPPPVPTVPPPGSLPPLPPPRSVPALRIMPASGPSDAEYVGAFLEEFGAAQGKPVVFTDVIGEPVVITDAFFRLYPGGPYKVDKRGRQKFVRVIADTIRQPDEIWWVWEERSGEMTLRRHYVAHWTVPGQDARLAVVMDVAPDGWRGVTAFEVGKSRELEKRRRGTLAWRRP